MRFRALTVVVAILALAGTAVGQRVRVKEHDKKDKKIHEHAPPPQQGISVTGFAPQTGPVGAAVTIGGSGFLPQTKVVVGGRPVKTDAQTATAITFTVPARYGDGVIVLRHPGAANDAMVGTFVVQLAPEIVRFLPIAGPAGTRVEIAGAGFANGDQVLFNGKALSISELGPTRIVVTIPPGATSDFFVLARPSTGQKDQARKPFNVTLPPPAITGFSPTSGPPGTTVRLSGANFAQTDRVYYGGTGLLPSNRGEGWVEVQIPPNARQNFPLTVRNQRGEAAVTQQPFALVLPPAITAFNPAFGPAGARVEILGAAFMKGDEVRLGARALKVLDLADGRITVEIPADGRTDLFAI